MTADIKSKASIMTKLLLCLILQSSLVSCGGYNSSFSCPDAKGGRCLAMDKIDHLINSGEIEKITGADNACVGKKCSSNGKSKFLSKQKQLPTPRDTNSANIYYPEESKETK